MLSTLEKLPDEVLMLIFNYSGDFKTILRKFLGLNQRLNNILLDARLHLLTDFLHVSSYATDLNGCRNSSVFQDVTDWLSSVNTEPDEQKLDHYLHQLIIFYTRQQYTLLEEQVRSSIDKFQSVRQHLSTKQILDVDRQLKESFSELQANPITMDSTRIIESLIFIRGARLECLDDDLSPCNLALAINKLILVHLNNVHTARPLFITSITRMLKAVIISNIQLLNNRLSTRDGICNVWHFLFYSIYQLQYFYHTSSDTTLNMRCYRAVIELLLFLIQCQKQMCKTQRWTEESIFDILNMIYSAELVDRKGIFIKTMQYEILNIIVDCYASSVTTLWNDILIERFGATLNGLIKKDRLDVILLLHQRIENVRHFFHQPRECRRKTINLMTGNRTGRQLLTILIDKKPFDNCFIDEELLFVLLQKRERKLLQRVLQLSPFLVHQLDSDGNDPLLFICLKVLGCRHQIVKFLLNIGCDPERKNVKGENFIDAIKLTRNRTLLKKLVEGTVIEIDDESGIMQLNLEKKV